MNMERNSDDELAALSGSMETAKQGRRLAKLAMAGLTLFLLLWNLLFFAMAFASMPANDFGRPLMATQEFLQGRDMYGETKAVVFQYSPETVIRLWDLNPPHSHFLYLPLAVAPSWLALPAWYVLSGLCLYGSIGITVSEIGIGLTPRRKQWMIVGLMSFSAMGVAVAMAHMSFPLMLLVTLAWRNARHGRWGKAGSWLGLALSIKPFLLIFVPYLVLKGCWRGVAAVGLTTGLAFLVGLLVFGLESHRSWLRVISRADSWAWLPLNASLYGIMSRVLMKNPLFTPMVTLEPSLVRVVWLALGIPAGLVALYRTFTDPVSEGTDRAFGILLVSAVLLSPLGWIYYFWLPVGPIVATVHAWWIERSKEACGGNMLIGSPSGYLFLSSMVGMAVPVFFFNLLQPSRPGDPR